MTEEDLKKIEALVGASLPSVYRSTMLNFPFDENSVARDYYLPNDADYILEVNKSREWVNDNNIWSDLGQRERSHCPLLIGSDGGEISYIFDLNQDSTSVYALNAEKREIERAFATFEDFLSNISSIDNEVREDQKVLASSRPWWKIFG